MSEISRMFQDEAVNVECGEDKESKLSEEEIFDNYKNVYSLILKENLAE